MQALAMQKRQSAIPMPSKRTSVYSPRRKEQTTGACVSVNVRTSPHLEYCHHDICMRFILMFGLC